MRNFRVTKFKRKLGYKKNNYQEGYVTKKRFKSNKYSRASRIAGTAAGTVLGYISGGIPGAYAGGKGVYKRLSEKKSRTVSFSRGKYGKKFKKTRKIKIGKEAMMLRDGYHLTEETFGAVGDAHCCYIQHSTYNVNLISRAIAGALIRKVFKKAGVDMGSRNQELPLFGLTDSDGFRLEYTLVGPTDGGVNTQSYTIPNDQNLTTIITNFGQFRNHISDTIRNINQNEPYKLCLYSSDRNGFDTNWRLASSIDLRSELIEVTITSQLRVQNRSAGADAAAAEKFDLDRVDVQPLRGYLYDHRHSDPRVSDLTTNAIAPPVLNLPISRMRTDGIQLVRAANLSVDQFNEPPNPKYWENCSKAVKVTLDPSQIKTCYVKYDIKGYLPKLLVKMRVGRSQTVDGVEYFGNALGRSQTIALEELIRTNDANPITLQYEREYKIGARSITKKSSVLLTEYNSKTYDNI